MTRRVSVGLLALSVMLAGCTQTDIRRGTPLTLAAVQQVVLGDRKPRVLELLGPPVTVEAVSGGSRFRYRFRAELRDELELSFLQASFSWTDQDDRQAEVWLRFDRQGRVVEISYPRAGGRI